MKKYASFAEMDMILITIPKAQLLPFVTLINWKNLLLLKHLFLSLQTDFASHVFFFFDFLIPFTETAGVYFNFSFFFYNWCLFQFIKATSKTWILKNLDSEKSGPSKTWTLKSLDPEKPGINIGLKNMSDFRELCFIKTIRNMSYCLKVRVLTDI